MKPRPVALTAFLTIALGATDRVSAQNFVFNGSFESPALGFGNYQYGAIVGSGWAFMTSPTVGGSGITHVPSLWTGASGRPPFSAPDGNQIAFLQSVGNSLSQTITLPSDGSYSMSYQHAGRSFFPPVSGNPSQGGNLTYSILMDSVPLGTFSTTTDMPFTSIALTFAGTSGAHLFEFLAVSGGAETVDQTAFFDGVSVTAVPEPTAWPFAALGVGLWALARRRRSA